MKMDKSQYVKNEGIYEEEIDNINNFGQFSFDYSSIFYDFGMEWNFKQKVG